MSSNVQAQQQEEINELRTLLNPSPVKQQRIPKWLRTKLRAAKRAGKIELLEYESRNDYALVTAAAHAASGSGWGTHGWLDHWGTTETCLHDELFVCEPYELGADALQSVAKFAELLGINYEVHANSWHFPGKTIRILFWYKTTADTE